MANLTGHADRIGELGAVIRHGRDGLEMVSLRWGLEPAEPDGRPFEVVRAEGREFPARRCLAPASEFFVQRRGKRFRCALTNGDWFYLAGIWRPATPRWPTSYAVLTIDANDDVGVPARAGRAMATNARRCRPTSTHCPRINVRRCASWADARKRHLSRIAPCAPTMAPMRP